MSLCSRSRRVANLHRRRADPDQPRRATCQHSKGFLDDQRLCAASTDPAVGIDDSFVARLTGDRRFGSNHDGHNEGLVLTGGHEAALPLTCTKPSTVAINEA